MITDGGVELVGGSQVSPVLVGLNTIFGDLDGFSLEKLFPTLQLCLLLRRNVCPAGRDTVKVSSNEVRASSGETTEKTNDTTATTTIVVGCGVRLGGI